MHVKPTFNALTLAVALAGITVLKVQAAETIDVMVLYTDEAGLSDPAAAINAHISYANTVVKNSEVGINFRVVHSQKINFTNDSAVNISALYSLANNSTVAQLREEHGADLVTIITNRVDSSCGIGFLPRSNANSDQLGSSAERVAFSVVGRGCNTAMIHEFGHNMSLGHSYAQDSVGSIWDWARGHGINGKFVTAMAYTNAYNTNNRVPYFSNPALSNCDNLLCGKDINDTDGANSALALNRIATQIRDFRPEKTNSSNNNSGTTADTEPPTAPTALRAQQTTQTSIDIAWQAASDNTAVTGYDVMRNGARVATVATTRYSDQRLQADQTYSYTVVAFDQAGNRSPVSNPLIAKTKAAEPITAVDNIAPGVPQNVQVTAVTHNRVELAWQPSTDDTAVVGYQVYRDGIVVGTTRLPRYNNAGLNASTSYRYQVLAIDTAGNRSELSLALSVTTEKAIDTSSNNPTANDNLLSNGDFSNGRAGWFGFYARLYISNNTESTAHAIVAHRHHPMSGIVRNISSALEAGKSYNISSLLQHDSPISQQGSIYMVYSKGRRHAEWHRIATGNIINTAWTTVSGSFTVPESDSFRRAYLVINGPDRGTTLAIDDITLKQL